MFVQLGNEYLNLDRVVRVRFNKTWKYGEEDMLAEIEGFVHGELQVFARYRGQQALDLLEIFQEQNVEPVVANSAVPAVSQAAKNTLHDIAV